MKFIDKVKLKIKAGKGGDGAVAFRRELYVPKGGPAGGDGGNGGDVIFIGDEGVNTLLELNYQKEIHGFDGENGQHKNMHGKNAKASYIKVPIGTLIYEAETGKVIGDIIESAQEVVVATGGRGGKGNSRFATSRNRAPSIFTRGDLGEEKTIICELKLLADVGVIGMPNAGKSTLLSVISNAKPAIGDFPFTTLIPQLGVVKGNNFSFVVADLPGLIENASLGKGLGHEFLRHIERCRLLIHLVDMSNPDAIENYEIILKELKNYNLLLEKKEQIVVASKMDEEQSIDNLKKFQQKIKKLIIPISSWTRTGIDELIKKVNEQLQLIQKPVLENKDDNDSQTKVYEFKPEADEIIIQNLGNGRWKVSGASVFKIYHKLPLTTHDNLLLFNKKLRELGVYKKLAEKGIKKGDTIQIFDYQLEWVEDN